MPIVGHAARLVSPAADNRSAMAQRRRWAPEDLLCMALSSDSYPNTFSTSLRRC